MFIAQRRGQEPTRSRDGLNKIVAAESIGRWYRSLLSLRLEQIFSASYPQRVRSLTLTDCDVHDNWPPAAFKPFLAMAAGGGLRGTLEAMLSNKDIYRSPQALGPAYEDPEQLTDESETYLRPLVRTEQGTRDLQRFLAAFDNAHTRAVEARLKTLNVTFAGN